jgi:hemerythrin-like metal-binding protein
MQWSAAYEFGIAPMDETHREFVERVAALAAAADAELAGLLGELIVHTVAHFEQEKCWMEASGFPPISCHTGEHERVLEVLRDVRNKVGAGDLALGRTLVKELPAWFENHASTMDAALAFFLKETGALDAATVPEGAG